jgi:hypothetical protein
VLERGLSDRRVQWFPFNSAARPQTTTFAGVATDTSVLSFLSRKRVDADRVHLEKGESCEPALLFPAKTRVRNISQTLPREHWELILVDNASKHPLAEQFNPSWPQAFAGAGTWALVGTHRGMREAAADIIVFVDGDNVLDRDYLAGVIKLGEA